MEVVQRRGVVLAPIKDELSVLWRSLPRDALLMVCEYARPRPLFFERVDDACLMRVVSKVRCVRDESLRVRLVRVSPLMQMSTMVYSLLHELYPDIWQDLMDLMHDFEGSFASSGLRCVHRVSERLSTVLDLLVCAFSISIIPPSVQSYVLRYMILSQVGLRALARILVMLEGKEEWEGEGKGEWEGEAGSFRDEYVGFACGSLPRVSHEWSRMCEKSPLLYNFDARETQLYSMSLSDMGVPRCSASLQASLNELQSLRESPVPEKTLLGVFLLRDLRCLFRRGDARDVSEIRFYERRGDFRVLSRYPWYSVKSL